MKPKRFGKLPFGVPPRLVAIALGCAAVGAVLFGSIAIAARGCRGGHAETLEERVARLESAVAAGDARALGDGDGGAASAPMAGGGAGAESSPECAVAKVDAYKVWQEALAKAKSSAAPAQAACTHIWSEEKKQQCYHTASAGVRTVQAARDAVVPGGASARAAVKNVKYDPKNDAIGRARAASEAAFAACHDENEY
jgi:hypothetical protein